MFRVVMLLLKQHYYPFQSMLSKQIRNDRSNSRLDHKDSYNHNDRASSQSRPSPANIRVVQSHLVYVIGLQPEICTQYLLASKEYFGKYGKVLKVVINKKGSTNRRYQRDLSYAAHITYEDEVSASLAVISLFEFKYAGFTMRSCFGYSKYCENFYFGKDCHNSSCLYLHRFNPEQEIVAGHGCDKQNERDNFNKQLMMALKIIFNNRKQIIHDCRQEREYSDAFPDAYESMRLLVDQDYMTEDEYQQQWQIQDTLKCYTESTETSPLKEQQTDQQRWKHEAQQPASQNLNAIYIQDQSLEEQIQMQKQMQKQKQNTIQRQEQKELILVSSCQTEQFIGRSILKILKSKNRHSKSKFEFVTTPYEQCHRALGELLQREILFMA